MTGNSASNGGLAAGVIGVGSMGRQHTRVYSELPGVTLVGVHDADGDRADAVAAEYETRALSRSRLLEAADVVSVAVPTAYHYDATLESLRRGVDVLVEKPFVRDRERGRELARVASEAGLTLQVGHVERFNPAVRVLADIVPDLDVVAFDVDRLGPPVDRQNDDSVVMDLMIHDLDILLSLVDGQVESIAAAARDDRHVTVQFRFADGTVAGLTASRVTQEKIRRLAVTALSCRVNVDFIEQSVEIHRQSLPEYVEADGDIRYRHESVVERPMIENGEPLKHELSAFVDAATAGNEPLVTPEDALRVLEVAERIEALSLDESVEVSPR